MMFIFFNLTFFPLFLVGLLGQPRRVFEYATEPAGPERLLVGRARSCLGASFLIFVANFVWSMFIDPQKPPGQPVGLAGPRVADGRRRCRAYNFERIPVILTDPYHYGERGRPGRGRPRRGIAGAAGAVLPEPPRDAEDRRPPDQRAVTDPRLTETTEPSHGRATRWPTSSEPSRDPRGDRLSSCAPPKGRSGPAAACSSASSPSPSPPWPSPTSTCGRRTTTKLWRPDGVTAPTGIGAGHLRRRTWPSALLTSYGPRRLRRGQTLDWEVAGWITVARRAAWPSGLQIWELTQLPFFPGSSGYASCFVGWAAMNIALLLAGVYWLETLLARCCACGGPSPRTGARRARRCRRPGCSGPTSRAAAYFWGFIAARERALLGTVLCDLISPARSPSGRVVSAAPEERW